MGIIAHLPSVYGSNKDGKFSNAALKQTSELKSEYKPELISEQKKGDFDELN